MNVVDTPHLIEGHAAIPKAGMEAIPKQLLNNLKTTTFQYNTKVTSVEEGEITLKNGNLYIYFHFKVENSTVCINSPPH